MKDESLAHLHDAHQAGGAILAFVAERTFEEYEASELPAQCSRAQVGRGSPLPPPLNPIGVVAGTMDKSDKLDRSDESDAAGEPHPCPL